MHRGTAPALRADQCAAGAARRSYRARIQSRRAAPRSVPQERAFVGALREIQSVTHEGNERALARSGRADVGASWAGCGLGCGLGCVRGSLTSAAALPSVASRARCPSGPSWQPLMQTRTTAAVESLQADRPAHLRQRTGRRRVDAGEREEGHGRTERAREERGGVPLMSLRGGKRRLAGESGMGGSTEGKGRRKKAR